MKIAVYFALALQLSASVSPEFAARRAKLRSSIPDGVFVLFGGKESDDLHQAWFQQTDFYYLTGWDEPSAILIITPDPEKDAPQKGERAKAPREILFLPQRAVKEEKWTGRKAGPPDTGQDDSEARAETGFQTIMAAERFENALRALLDVYPKLYTLTDDPASAALRKLAPLRSVTDVRRPLSHLRMVKSETEAGSIVRSTNASIDAHRAVWKTIAPGKYEYQVEAVMTETWLNEGCRRSAYAPIIGSGPNSTTLHYSANSRRMDAGEVVVIDVAAECNHYASDITRTLPVGGKFTPRQREIYDVVLGAQRAAIAAVKPGATIAELYKIAHDYIETHGKDLHGQALGQYFTTGLSHHVGLDVHDASDNAEPLKSGMVITVEPGIYLPEENIGIRIEDVIEVTGSGAMVLSSALPTDPDEIERALAQRN